MSSDSVEKKSPDSQVKAAQAVGNNNQLKYPHGSERIPFGVLSQKSQEAMPNAVVATTLNSNLSKSPKLHAAGVRKSQSIASKKSSSFSSNKKQKVKLKKQTASATSGGHSDSDDSDDDVDDMDRRGDSQSQEPRTVAPSASRSISGGGTSQRMAQDEWEILEGLKNGQLFEEVPQKYSGVMMKSRKWPMKGWHKRFFLLENGILIYGKNPGDIEKGKHHGVVDIGLSVIACKRKGRRIDVDADDLIYHLKVKSSKEFDEWTTQLRHHRLHRHHEITYGTKDTTSGPRGLVSISSPVDQYSSLSSPISPDGTEFVDGLERRDGGGIGGSRVIDRQQGKVSTWLADSSSIDGWDKELTSVQLKMFELTAVLEKLQHATNSGSSTYVQEFQDLAISSSSKKVKSSSVGSKKPLLMKTQKKDRKSKDRLSVADGLMTIHMSTSNPNLLTMDEPILIGASMKNGGAGGGGGGSDSRDFDLLQELFYRQAEEVHSSLKTVCRSLTLERERLRQALESDNYVAVHSNANYIQSLKQSLAETLKQNTEYRNRLNRIHAESGATDFKPIVSPLCLTSVYMASGPPSEKRNAKLQRGRMLKARPGLVLAKSHSVNISDRDEGRMHFANAGSLDSLTEFYDAAEQLTSCSDVSEDQEEEEEDEDMSDAEEETKPLPAADELHSQFTRFQLRRRSKLPSPKVESDVGVWSLLRKNIGKDLSKISMPVSMNEPLNALQRLCEELEYSELLDRCADLEDPFERMVWIAAFAVSGYSSTYTRAGQKPFNPVLGETYECIREDKGWKFVAEQVSHHPPVSTCFCESTNFLFWQDMQVKTKFWGKSMEVEPIGVVNVKLTKHEEHYSWNKATSCVHNILGGQRWVEHYGEVTITNHKLDIVCKLTLAKSSYWSTNRHEVYGSVLNKEGKVVHHLFGKWNEGIYFGDVQSAKCIWRPGAMPPDSSIYYGFTRFAMELNEIDSEQVQLYPPTDTRFRPDQRLLEEGKLNDAESEKQRLEQLQREMRKGREEENIVYTPKWFTKSEMGKKETYRFNNQYWEVRKHLGFAKLDFPKLW